MRLALALATVVVASGLLSAPAQAATAGQVRLDQVGYGTAESSRPTSW
jgi:hypothetical protein